MDRMLFCSGTGWPFRTAVLFMLLLGLAVPSASTLAMGDRPDADTPLEAGRVLTARGEVIARQPGGEARALTRGDRVYEGDTLLTGDGGRAQIRFIDQGLVQLQPRTEFIIEHYRETEGEEGAMTRLVEGGLRALSGSIGQRDREHYRLDTPVASIGIRGTHYALNHCAADCAPGLEGTVGGVISGRIAVNNDAGEREFGRNQFFSVPDRNTPPRRLSRPPAGLLDATDADEGEEEDEEEGAVDEEGAVSEATEQAGGESSSDNETLPAVLADDDLRLQDFSVDGVACDRCVAGFTFAGGLGILFSGRHTYDDNGDSFTHETILYADTSGTHPILQGFDLSYNDSYYDESWSASLFGLDGHSPEDIGGHTGFGVGWGRWAEGSYSVSHTGEDGQPQGDWYYVLVDDIDRITTDFSGLGNLGNQSFSWYGGVSSHTINEFTISVDFSENIIFDAYASFDTASGSLVFQGLDWNEPLSEYFLFDITGAEGSYLLVDGSFLGRNAEGAMIVFDSEGASEQINGAGLLTR